MEFYGILWNFMEFYGILNNKISQHLLHIGSLVKEGDQAIEFDGNLWNLGKKLVNLNKVNNISDN